MAAILLGVDLAADTDTSVYTPGVGKTGSVSLRVVNRGATAATVSVWSIYGTTHTAYFDVGAVIASYGVLNETRLVVPDGVALWVRSSSAVVSATVQGWED